MSEKLDTTLLQFAMDYGVHYEQRTILINGTINYNFVRLVDAALTEFELEPDRPVTIRINSSGGGLYEAFAIVGRITSSPCHIITEGYGQVMSAATIILACGDERRMSKYTWFMWHEVAAGYEGKVTELKGEIKQLQQEHEQFLRMITEFSNKPLKYWKAKGVEDDFFMNAKQCKAVGLIEEII